MTSAATISIDWREAGHRLVSGTPAWALAVIGGAVLITALLVGLLALSRLSKRKTEREQHRREVLAFAKEQGEPAPAEPLRMDPKPLLGGIAVSLYGLWGFATGTLSLPVFFAIGFVSMFDVLELRLFALMYKSADPAKGWTPQLRLLQTTAWGFVAASAIANIAHAPNAIAAPFMALMPIGAAWVIELDLRRALAGKEAEEKPQQQGTKPGPFRLAALLWRRLWAWGFRVAGLDVTDRADEMVRRARARDAADASYELRKALKEKEDLEAAVGSARVPRGRGKGSEEQKHLVRLNRKLEKKIRPKAQTALELADTQDPEQGLQLMQRMAWLTRADDVALLDYGPDSPAMDLLEELNIAANADFVKSRKRALDAEQRAAEAEKTRLDAERAVTEATEKLVVVEELLERTREQAEETREQAAAERDREEKRLEALRDERALLESSDATAAQLYQKTSVELDALKAQLNDLQEERGKLSTAYSEVQREAQESRAAVLRLQGEQQALQVRLDNLRDERERLTTAADQARKEADETRLELEKTRGQLAALERVQSVPARGPGRAGGVHAVVDEEERSTRERIRAALETLTPEQRRLSQREQAVLIEPKVPVKADSIRRHLRELAREPQPGLPAPREDEDDAARPSPQ
ncbi:hypothetical protein [Streptomyces sp. NPDC088925]|uniref:hypothetical protein n=1 Tax=Streptomyces sp. NPDC088925 TaxID=3365914 RepID=UPI0038215E26